jgi:hypothetical protein
MKGVRPFSDKFEVEIQIVDHCNLKCDNCNHLANIASPWFMSKEEFEFTLQKIKEELLPHGLKRVMILGGEPLLHPQILEFCMFARETFPVGVDIDLLTNGILLTSELSSKLKQFVAVAATPYPEVKVSKQSVHNFMYNRLFFGTNPVNENGNSPISYFDCPRYSMPMLFVRDYKMFVCPFSGCSHIYNETFNKHIPLTKGDYLDIREMTYEKVVSFVNKGPSSICKYCERDNLTVFWNRGDFNQWQDYQGETWQNMFINNYKKYDILINGKKIIAEFDAWDKIDEEYGIDMLRIAKSRKQKKLDIIIPIYHVQEDELSRLLNQLYKQTAIKDCHVYIISDCSPNEDILVQCVANFKSRLNITLLKTPSRSGPGAARQLGIDNSFNPYLFFMDSDDELVNFSYFENAISELEKDKELDIVCGNTVLEENGEIKDIGWLDNQDDAFRGDIHSLVYRRNSIQNCRFLSIFISEDADWSHQLYKINPKCFYINDLTYIYHRNSETSIGKESNYIDFFLYRMYVNQYSRANHVDSSLSHILSGGELLDFSDQFSDNEIKDFILLSFYFGYIFYYSMDTKEKIYYHTYGRYQKDYDEANRDEENFSKILYDKIIKDDLTFYHRNKTFSTLQDYEVLLQTYIEKSTFKENLREVMYEISDGFENKPKKIIQFD